MFYPDDFPPQARAKVEAEKIKAGRDYDSQTKGLAWEYKRPHLENFILRIFLRFASEARDLRLWPADEMDRQCRDFLREITSNAEASKNYTLSMSRYGDGSFAIDANLKREFEETPKWQLYEDILLTVAESKPSTVETTKNLMATNSSESVASAQDSALVRTPKARWYASKPEILNRRRIALNNPKMSAKSLCNVFDGNKLPIPAHWEEKFGVMDWKSAYKNSQVRPMVDRIISTDRRSEKK